MGAKTELGRAQNAIANLNESKTVTELNPEAMPTSYALSAIPARCARAPYQSLYFRGCDGLVCKVFGHSPQW